LCHHLVLAFSLDPHLSVVLGFHHRDCQVQHDVRKEHRSADPGDPEKNLVPIRKPIGVRLSNGDVEDEEDLLCIAIISSCECVECGRKSTDEGEEDNKKEAHLVYHRKDHTNEMADFSEVAQEVEHL
jgi:hypothetical protein